jgi:hypothetical protein
MRKGTNEPFENVTDGALLPKSFEVCFVPGQVVFVSDFELDWYSGGMRPQPAGMSVTVNSAASDCGRVRTFDESTVVVVG